MPIYPPPSYADISSTEPLPFPCNICNEVHLLKEPCKSKPLFPPSAYFPRCDTCYGYHPRGHCYFEYLRHSLFTLSMCERCDTEHIGFCNDALLCQICNTKHNFADGCSKQIKTDLSDDLCPRCHGYHSLHCPPDLLQIRSEVVLWCNRCKIGHSFMNCVPFCNHCQRRHHEGPCPGTWTYCVSCSYCHQGESCPKATRTKTSRTPKKIQEEVRQSDIEACINDHTASFHNRFLSSTFQELDHLLNL